MQIDIFGNVIKKSRIYIENYVIIYKVAAALDFHNFFICCRNQHF